VSEAGACTHCGARIPGRFGAFARPFGPRRIPVRLAA
jgi:pyruvate formate lyase activating enzyme